MKVALVVGSSTDLPLMREAQELLKRLGIEHELRVISAHRRPEELFRYARELERRGVRVEEDLWEGGSPLTIWADELMLRMAFLNVVRNALEAMEGVPERRLTVRTRCLEGAVMVEVQDRGPGVRPELREQVFEPHFTTKPSGSGLGLTMARKALESHGGTIVLESPPEGGTVVRMVLPIRPMLALQEPQP